MSDQAAAEAQAPQAEVTPTPEGVQPQTSVNEAAPANSGITETPPATEASEPQTLDEVMALLNEQGNHKLPIDPDAPQAEVANAEQEEAQETPEQAAPEAEAETTEEEETQEEAPEAEKAPKRIRLNNVPAASRAKMVAVSELLREKPELSFEQALAELGFSTPAEAKAETRKAPEAKTEEAAPVAETSEAIEARIAALNKDRRAALKAFDNEKAVELEEQAEALQTELTQARTREAQARDAETQRARSFSEQVGASVKEAATLYPDVLKEGTPLFKAISEDMARLQAAKSPLLQDPEYPLALAAKHAAKLRVPPSAPAPTPQAPRPVARPRPAPAPGMPASPRTTQPVAPPKAADPEQDLANAMAFLNQNGNRQVAAA